MEDNAKVTNLRDQQEGSTFIISMEVWKNGRFAGMCDNEFSFQRVEFEMSLFYTAAIGDTELKPG